MVHKIAEFTVGGDKVVGVVKQVGPEPETSTRISSPEPDPEARIPEPETRSPETRSPVSKSRSPVRGDGRGVGDRIWEKETGRRVRR